MSELASPLVLIAACLLSGIAVGALAYTVAAELAGRGLARELARAAEARLLPARVPAGGLVALAAPLLPFSTALGRVLGLGSLRATLAQRYARAGFPGGLDDDELIGLGLLLGLPLALPVVALLAAIEPLLAPVGLLLLLTGPGLLSSIYGSQGNERERAIARVLPFVLDLLVLTMRAGASLQQALERVAGDYAKHPIGREFQLVLADLATGTTVREAFESLQERVPIAPVRTFVDDLVQGDELGRPLADIFERQADQARVRRVQDATETAGRAKVLVLIPGMLVFIAVLILLFAPFFVRWYYGGLTV